MDGIKSSAPPPSETKVSRSNTENGLVRRSRQRKSTELDRQSEDSAVFVDLEDPETFPAVKYDPAVHPNPYRYWPEYTTFDYLLMALMIPLLPFKLIGIALCFLVSMIVCPFILWGVDRAHPPKEPFTGLRSTIGSPLIYFIIRCLFFFIGIVWIQFKRVEGPGEDEIEWAAYDESQAPVIVAAPHTSYLDSVAVAALRCSPVARMSSRKNPFTGWPMDAIQTIWVDRHSTQNRQQAADLVVQRQREPGWPPTIIFPEGTTTAGNVLYFFKNGAFRSGRPALPVTIRYTVATSANPCTAFAWDGPAVWRTAIHILLQPYIIMTFTLLPLYVPDETEATEPNVYAQNVQKMFSAFLDMPYSKITMDDAEAYAAKVRSVHSKKRTPAPEEEGDKKLHAETPHQATETRERTAEK